MMVLLDGGGRSRWESREVSSRDEAVVGEHGGVENEGSVCR